MAAGAVRARRDVKATDGLADVGLHGGFVLHHIVSRLPVSLRAQLDLGAVVSVSHCDF